MIIINRTKADINNILNEYHYDTMQQDIINVLNLSNTEYKYDSVNQLKFELMLRKEIVKSANELSESEIEFQVFEKSKCNPKYWDRKDDGGFLLKSGVTPSDSIHDIFLNSSLYATECSTAIVIIYYKALINVFKKELFNKLFPKIRLKNWHSLDNLLKEGGVLKKENDYLPGDRRYIENPDVDPDFPECQGENVIDIGQGLYYGHGVGVSDLETIINELNKFRIKHAKKSAFLKDSAGRLNFKKLSAIYYNFNR